MPIGLFAKIEKRNHENKRRVAKDAEKRGENLFLERSDEPSASLSPRRFSDLATNRIGTEPTTSEDWLNGRVLDCGGKAQPRHRFRAEGQPPN
jgi:hypothetical protein